MSSSSSGGRGLSFSIGGLGAAGQRPAPRGQVFHVLVAADASGRAARGVLEPLAGRSLRRVDVDRLDAVEMSWRARIPVWLGAASEPPTWLEPMTLDDLHPEQLLDEVPELSHLFDRIGALDVDPAAAVELAALLGHVPNAPTRDAREPAAAASVSAAVPALFETSSDTLSRLLGGTRSAAERPPAAAPVNKPAGSVDIAQFIRAIVNGQTPTPNLEASPEVHALEALAVAELHRCLRTLLRAPAFRALEATWLGIQNLCRNCPDPELVRFSVLDARFDELGQDLGELARILESEKPDVLLVDHLVAASSAELGALAQLLEVCERKGVLLVAGAVPALAGCAHFAEVADPEENELVLAEDVRAAWASIAALRERGARLGLALPRFILRQPYGAAGEPLEVPFEELVGASDHEAFVWGNGAYLLARALCLQHVEAPEVRPDGSVDVRELPVVYLQAGVDSRVKPCAESWLSDRAVGRLRGAGFSVLQAVRDTDRIVVRP